MPTFFATRYLTYIIYYVYLFVFPGTRISHIEEDLMDRILELLRADICYTIKRLLPADLKTFSNLRNTGTDASANPSYHNNPFYDEFTIVPNEKYGGITVAPFFVYNR